MESISPEVLKALARYDTPTLANAIETFDVRSRADGFMGPDVRSSFPELTPVVGYAVTGRIRSRARSNSAYAPRDWWAYVLSRPTPRIVVFQDLDDPPGVGAFWGEVQSNIHRTLGCVAAITNGSVRDLSEARKLPFAFFAGSVAVSHAFAHIVDFASEVKVGGLVVRPGDLLHADQHGVLSIPLDLAASVPAAADEVVRRERLILEHTRSSRFSIDELARLV